MTLAMDHLAKGDFFYRMEKKDRINLREVGEFNLDDWNWDRKCERDRAHRAEVEEMRWRIEEARSFFDPEFFM